MTTIVRLVGVYDADGGLRGELSYLLGKARGRHCSLCDITHSPVRRRREWDDFVATLPVPFDVVHRNERDPAVKAATAGREPCVVAKTIDGIVLVLDGADLGHADSVGGLADALDAALLRLGLSMPSGATRG